MLKSDYSPILLICYKRLTHLKATLEYLEQNENANRFELYIFVDGPKNKDVDETLDVQRYIENYRGNFKKIYKTYRSRNLGLATNIIDSLTSVINEKNKAILLEDDILTSKYFLSYMNDALNQYENIGKVMHVSGYMYPLDTSNLNDTFFLNQASCWGWGTWKRAWKLLDTNEKQLLKQLNTNNKIDTFTFDGWSDFLTQLQMNIDGSINTWAIKWYASIVIHNGLCLHPKVTLTNNIGFDGSGENCKVSQKYITSLSGRKIEVNKLPLVESNLARQMMINYYKTSTSTPQKILHDLYNRLPSLRAFIKYVRNLRNY